MGRRGNGQKGRGMEERGEEVESYIRSKRGGRNVIRKYCFVIPFHIFPIIVTSVSLPPDGNTKITTLSLLPTLLSLPSLHKAEGPLFYRTYFLR